MINNVSVNNLDNNGINNNSSLPLIRKNAHKITDNFFNHVYSMLTQLQNQYRTTIEMAEKTPEVQRIYLIARNKIEDIHKELKLEQLKEFQTTLKEAQASAEKSEKIISQLSSKGNKTKKENKLLADTECDLEKNNLKIRVYKLKIETLKKQIQNPSNERLSEEDLANLLKNSKKANKRIVEIIHQTQLEVLAEIGARGGKEKIKILAQGGLKATWIKIQAFVSEDNRLAVKNFKDARDLMIEASKEEIWEKPNTQIDENRKREFDAYRLGSNTLKHRNGVIKVNNAFRLVPYFTKKEIASQFISFKNQEISDKERRKIEKKFEFNGNEFTSLNIPINDKFDSYLRDTIKDISNAFKSKFGSKGVSALNRKESCLINAFLSSLKKGKTTLFSAIRHAIIDSNEAAEDFFKAHLANEIHFQGLTLAEAKAKGIITLNINSVSLVTPDKARRFANRVNKILGISKRHDDERALLAKQMEALKTFKDRNTKTTAEGKEVTVIKIEGVELEVDIQINAFNFAVNGFVRSVCGLKFGGFEQQLQYNKEALEGLKSQVRKFFLANIDHGKNDEETKKINREINNLWLDIKNMLKDKEAYLDGNQYEVGAKVLILTHLMASQIEKINKNLPKDQKISGYNSAFNCKSGKDRTGIMEAMAQAYTLMADNHEGHYPTHKELKNPKVQEDFKQAFKIVASRGGGLDITELNTDYDGFKVTPVAVEQFGLEDEFFKELVRFAKFTKG